MDLLFSIPLATYFLAPSLTSWSTSLNLLFFYMTWTTLILSHPPLKVHLVGLLAIRTSLYLLPSLATLVFDVGVPSLAESIKLGGKGALPPRDMRRLGRMMALAIFNLVLITGIEGMATLAFSYVFHQPEFKTSTTLPLPWQIVKHILLLLALREILVYYIHHFVLHSYSSSYISRCHKRYAHAYIGAPFSLQLFTDHPLPMLLHHFLPIYLPALLLRAHLLTYFLYVAFCTVESTVAMSGCNIVPGIIMRGVIQRSDIHYASGGSANFGTWGILGWFYGTTKGRDVLEDLSKEAEKHHIKKRTAKKADQGMELLQDGVNALMGNSNTQGPRRSTRKRTARKAF